MCSFSPVFYRLFQLLHARRISLFLSFPFFFSTSSSSFMYFPLCCLFFLFFSSFYCFPLPLLPSHSGLPPATSSFSFHFFFSFSLSTLSFFLSVSPSSSCHITLLPSLVAQPFLFFHTFRLISPSHLPHYLSPPLFLSSPVSVSSSSIHVTLHRLLCLHLFSLIFLFMNCSPSELPQKLFLFKLGD